MGLITNRHMALFRGLRRHLFAWKPWRSHGRRSAARDDSATNRSAAEQGEPWVSAFGATAGNVPNHPTCSRSAGNNERLRIAWGGAVTHRVVLTDCSQRRLAVSPNTQPPLPSARPGPRHQTTFGTHFTLNGTARQFLKDSDDTEFSVCC